MRLALALALALVAGTAQAADWPLPPGAEPSGEADDGALRLATGPWDGAAVPGLSVAGATRHRAWRVSGGGLAPGDLAAPLRQALVDQGFDILYDCADRDCGGFDFRFALPVLPEPGMHVDLGAYRYLSARSGDRVIALWVSRGPETGFVQISEATGGVAVQPLRGGVPVAPQVIAAPEAPDAPADTTQAPAPPADAQTDRPDLFATGSLVLPGVDFAPGARDMTDPTVPVLAQLAAWLAADPGRKLVLVGHTDAEGSLAGNVAVSRQRAEAVRRHLIDDYGAEAARITAEGAGWLAPRASNATEAGRAANRRVEALPR